MNIDQVLQRIWQQLATKHEFCVGPADGDVLEDCTPDIVALVAEIERLRGPTYSVTTSKVTGHFPSLQSIPNTNTNNGPTTIFVGMDDQGRVISSDRVEPGETLELGKEKP